MTKDVAHRTLQAIAEGLAARSGATGNAKRYDVGLTGGSDSIQSLKDMASDPLVDQIDWSLVHFWWGDERFVAEDDPDRNALQARRAFLDDLVKRGLLPAGNIHEMDSDERDSERVAAATDEQNDMLLLGAASNYMREMIYQLAGEVGSAVPVNAYAASDEAGLKPLSPEEALETVKPLDLLILGMGPDGHFGSLFPAPAHHEIEVTDRMVVGVSHSPKMPPLRISMTAPFMARSTRTWMMTKGEGKAAATAGVFACRNNPEFPSSFADGTEEFIWFTTHDTLTQVK